MNDKQKLQEKADALRRDLSELDAQIARMPSQPESVKPRIRNYEGTVPWNQGWLVLEFSNLEQREKAKAILEKMEFGDPPSVTSGQGGRYERLGLDGLWNGFWWDSWPSDIALWHMGLARKA